MGFSSITITAPDSANEGEVVNVSARIANIDVVSSYLFKTEIWKDADLLATNYDQIPPLGSKTYAATFTMPNHGVTILVRVERGILFEFDNASSKSIALEPETFHLDVHVPSWAAGGYISPGSGDYPAYSTVELTAIPLSGYQFTGWGGDASGISPTYSLYMDSDKYVEAYFELVPVPVYVGTITEKELAYLNIWQAIPLYDIPVDTRTRVRIWGRNDTDINQTMGIYWFVTDPDGYRVQERADWETFWTGPGLEQGFVGSGFDLSKVGKYTIWVELLMNPDAPQVVDRYIGDLCTVAAVIPEAEFKGFSVSEFQEVVGTGTGYGIRR